MFRKSRAKLDRRGSAGRKRKIGGCCEAGVCQVEGNAAHKDVWRQGRFFSTISFECFKVSREVEWRDSDRLLRKRRFGAEPVSFRHPKLYPLLRIGALSSDRGTRGHSNNYASKEKSQKQAGERQAAQAPPL